MTHDVVPPDHLEDRVVDALRRRGLIAATRRPWRAVAAAAAIAIAFAAGWTSGAGWLTAADGDRYVLLLYAGASAPGGAEVSRVDEYRRWAQSLRGHGRLVSGERLDDAHAVTLGGEMPAGVLQGYFVIGAASDREALAIARQHPHLRHGGLIVVRRIQST